MTKKIEDYTPEEAQAELLELITKAARRCAYDLRHAAQDVACNYLKEERSKEWSERANMWLTIFNAADDPKNYRAGLHMKIFSLECQIEKLKKLCKEKGIDIPDERPF